MTHLAPAFDTPVRRNGYLWWYVDAWSDDGDHGLTLIAFVGSVFSPYYAWARQRAGAAGVDPAEHCALNVALYGRTGARWAMTERSRAALHRSADELRIGPSRLVWQGDHLRIDISEKAVPWPKPVRGCVRLYPAGLLAQNYALDTEQGRAHHHWCPIAPRARVEVEFTQPALRWQGAAYFDSNRGDAPLERDFQHWHWSRADLPGGRTAVLYDVVRRAQGPLSLGLLFDANGGVSALPASSAAPLPASRWGVARATRCPPGTPASVLQTLEDGPFYARSRVRAGLADEPAEGVTWMHESLSLDRFAAPWVRWMLPFRMPRVKN